MRAIGDTEVLVLTGDDLSLALDMFPGLYREVWTCVCALLMYIECVLLL